MTDIPSAYNIYNNIVVAILLLLNCSGVCFLAHVTKLDSKLFPHLLKLDSKLRAYVTKNTRIGRYFAEQPLQSRLCLAFQLVSVGVLVSDLIGFYGFLQAINQCNHAYAFIVMWSEVFESVVSPWIKRDKRQLLSTTMTVFKLIAGVWYWNIGGILACVVRLIAFLIMPVIIDKCVRMCLLAMCNHASIALGTIPNLANRIAHVIENMDPLATVTTADILTHVDTFKSTFRTAADDIRNSISHLYVIKLVAFFLCCVVYLDFHVVVASCSSLMFVSSLSIKVYQIVFGQTTCVNSLIDKLIADTNSVTDSAVGVILASKLASAAFRLYSK
jgi:hypothetical protein